MIINIDFEPRVAVERAWARRSVAFGLTGFGLASSLAAPSAFADDTDQAKKDKHDAIETVVVTAKHSTLDALPEKILNTPQSINVVPAEVLRQQGAASLADALRNVPGVTLNAGEGGTHGDLVNLRGFSSGDDYFLDGLRDTGLYDRDVFDFDSVEVYKGPASTLFGRGSTGGVVNQVTKAPELYPIEDAILTLGNNAELRGTADINAVIDDDSAFRINLMGQRDNVVGRPFVRNQRWGIAPAYAWGLGTDTTVTLKYLHQQEDNIPDYGIPFLFGQPAPVAHNSFYGLPSDDRFKTDVDVVTLRGDHRFNDTFTLNDTMRYGHYWFDSRQTAPIYGTANCFNGVTPPYPGAPLCSSLPPAQQAPVTAENPLYPVSGTPLDQIDVLRDRPSSKGTISTMMNESDLAAIFVTGALSHHLVTGIEVDAEDADLTRFVNQNTVILPTPLLDPNPYESFPGTQATVSSRPLTKTATEGVFAVDTIDIGLQWNIVAGIRFDHFGATYNQPLGAGAHFHHNDNIGDPRAAVTYKPTENTSLYVSYGTSFDPSAEMLSLAASNQALGPERDRTFEAGAKAQVLDGMLALTAAVFQTVMTNARITDPLNPTLQTLAGTLRVNGVEFDAVGRITPHWEITAGYTYLAPRAVGLVAVGVPGPIPNTANNQGNLWTTYDFDDGLKLGAGLNFVSRRYAGTDTLTDPGTTIVDKVPGYVTWDGMVGYKINDVWEVQLNGYNLTNEFYYVNSYFTRPQENHVIPGAGRTFLLSIARTL
jgi:catecholate siderophore receptor